MNSTIELTLKTKLKSLLLILMLLLFSIAQVVTAQTTLITQGFETNDEGTDYRSNTFTDGSNDFWVRTDTSPEPGSSNNQTYSGKTGIYFWNGEDVDATENPLGSGNAAYLMIKTLDVSTYAGGTATVSIDIAADRNGSGTWETIDAFLIQYAFDGDIATGANSVNGLPTVANVSSGTYSNAGAFYGSGLANPSNHLSQDDSDPLDGTGDGANILNNTFTTYTFIFSIPGGASNMSVRFVLDVDHGGEVLAFDEIEITGSSTPVPVELTSFTAFINDNSVQLKWETATEVNNYGFDIERQQSEDGTQNTEWETIGFVQGHGNSNSPKSYEFIDDNPPVGNLEYRLKQIDTDGTFEYYGTTIEVNNSVTSVQRNSIPSEFNLEQNYPNPFNPETRIRYSLPSESRINIAIYNTLGQQIELLENKIQTAGTHELNFDASNLTSGVYIYRMVAEATDGSVTFRKINKMLLLR